MDVQVHASFSSSIRCNNISIVISFKSDSAGSLVAIIPALMEESGALQSIHDTTSKLAGIIKKSKDASAAFSSFAKVLSDSIPILKKYAEANQDVSDSIKRITGKAITNVDLLDLPGVKGAINRLKDAEYGVSSIFSDTINGIGSLSGFSGDLSNAANGFESVVTAKEDLATTVKNLEGVSGTAFRAAVIAGGVTITVKNAANGIQKLTKAMQSKISDSNGVDFSSVILGMNHLADAKNDLAKAINSLINLKSLL